jgi:hypothetical protein
LVSKSYKCGDPAEIIDHERLTHLAAPSNSSDAELVRGLHIGPPQLMLQQSGPPKVSCNFGGLQKSLSPSLRRATQLCRDLQNLDGHGVGATTPRADRHEVEFLSQVIVGSHCRRSTMPKPAILIFDYHRQCRVNLLAHCNVSGLMDGGSHKRVSKPHLHCIEMDQLGGDGGRKSVNSDSLGQQHFTSQQDFVE